MMTRTIDGIHFRVDSPSCWEMVHSWPDVRIFVIYRGAYGASSWSIRYSDAIHGCTRYFASREEAISLLADRRPK